MVGMSNEFVLSVRVTTIVPSQHILDNPPVGDLAWVELRASGVELRPEVSI